jgi:hypothetical protein
MKRYAVLMSLVVCGFVIASERNATLAGRAANAGKEASNASVDDRSSIANRVSRPGEYTGYSEAVYADQRR